MLFRSQESDGEVEIEGEVDSKIEEDIDCEEDSKVEEDIDCEEDSKVEEDIDCEEDIEEDKMVRDEYEVLENVSDEEKYGVYDKESVEDSDVEHTENEEYNEVTQSMINEDLRLGNIYVEAYILFDLDKLTTVFDGYTFNKELEVGNIYETPLNYDDMCTNDVFSKYPPNFTRLESNVFNQDGEIVGSRSKDLPYYKDKTTNNFFCYHLGFSAWKLDCYLNMEYDIGNNYQFIKISANLNDVVLLSKYNYNSNELRIKKFKVMEKICV